MRRHLLHRVVVHQHHVRRLDGSVRAHGAHRDADIRAAQHRRVVDAVAHKGKLCLLRFCLQQLLDLFDLAGREQLAVDLVDAKFRSDLVGYRFGVAGQHHRLVDAGLFQGRDGLLGVRLDDVGDDDVSGILAVNGHVDDGADAVAVDVRDAQAVHQLAVARGDRDAVNLCGDAVAADFLDVADAAAVDLFAVGALQALADRVGGGALHQRGVFQNLFVLQLVVVDRVHLKYSLSQRPCLVKYHIFCLSKSLHIVGTFDEHSRVAGSADTREEAQRDTDHQGTGTAYDKECKRPVYPCSPFCCRSHSQHPHKRREHRKGNGAVNDCRCIDTREFCNKFFGL